MDRNCNTTRGGLQVMYRPATGVLGSLIPASGDTFASIMFPQLVLPADASDEFSYWVEDFSTIPAGFFPLADDGSGTRGPYADGVYGPASVALYRWDVRQYAFPFTLTVGAAPDTTQPSLSGSIVISGLSTTGFTATCPVATDNVAVTGYQARRNGGSYADIAAGGRSVSYSGLTPGSAHTVEMRARDAAGNFSGALSANVTLPTAPPPPPPPPPGLTTMPEYTLGAPQDQILIVGGTASLAPGQRGLIAFDFRRYTSAPVNPVVTVLHESGPVDTEPAAVRRGEPVVQGTKVFQYVESPINEANYTLICQAENSEGQEFLIAGRLPIRSAS